jgi:hypothetical protein
MDLKNMEVKEVSECNWLKIRWEGGVSECINESLGSLKAGNFFDRANINF